MKKINSEINYKNDFFNIKVGTTDKKNPNVVYLDCSAYLEATSSKDTEVLDYSEDIKDMEEWLKKLIGEIFYLRRFSQNFIFVFDIPKDRFEMGKRSFLSVQIHWKTQPDTTLLYNNFAEYADNLTKFTVTDEVLKVIKDGIEEKYHFKVYKTKH